jgi:uncharacterized protein involved in type VI secretion and phage assembly
MSFVSLSGPAIEKLLPGTGPDALKVDHVEGEESLSGLFRYIVRFHIEHEPSFGGEGDGGLGEARAGANSAHSSAAPFSEVIGQRITMALARDGNPSRTVCGIVSRARQHGAGQGREPSRLASYRVEIRPQLWTLRFSRTSRTFADAPVVTRTSSDDSEDGILNRVLSRAGLSFVTDLKETYPPLKHVSQHDETDYAFFHRVAEEAGVVYWIDADGTVVLSDHNEAFDRFTRRDEAGTEKHTLVPISSTDKTDYEKALLSYSFEQNLVPETLMAQSVDFDQGKEVSASARGPDATAQETASEEVHTGEAQAVGTVREGPGGLTQYASETSTEAWTEGPNMSRRRQHQLRAAQKLLRGTTPARLLGAGHRFVLEEETCGDVLRHFDNAARMEFVVGRLLLDTEGNACTVEFEAFPIGPPPTEEGADTADTKYRGARYMKQSGGASPGGSPERSSVDRYALSAEATAGPGTQIQPGIYPATVTGLPEKSTHRDRAKQGMVKVEVDLGGQPNEEVWARVLTFWAGNNYGGHFLPRKHTKVAIAYPAQDSSEAPFVIGGFFDGTHSMPFADTPAKKSGIRGESRRTNGENGGGNGQSSETYLHNEISLIDEGGEEEIQILAPKYRTDVTGLDEDYSDEKSVYYERDLSGFPHLDADRITPHPRQYVTPQEKEALDSKEDAGVCALRDDVEELWSNEDFEGSRGRSRDEMRRISLREWEKYNKNTKIILKKEYRKKDYKMKETLSIEEYKKLPKERRFKVRIDDLLEETFVDYWGEAEAYRDLFEEGWVDLTENAKKKYSVEEIEEMSFSIEEIKNMPEKTTFEKWHTHEVDEREPDLEEEITGVNSVLWAAKESRQHYDGMFLEKWDEYRLKEAGKDLFTTYIGDAIPLPPFKKAYDTIKLGRDAYFVRPFREAYPASVEVDVRARGGQSRAEYIEGDGIEVTNGCFQLHAFGDRVEISRSSESNGDVFDKEFREEWEMNDLPDKHDRFDEKKHKPIAILSKDGSITIRSEKGINIESSKDINIQSNKNINMYAKKNITMEADKKIKSKSEKESIVESPKIYLEGTEGSGKVDVDAKKINVGSKDNTQQVKMAANSVKKKDNMNYTLGGGIKVEYKHYVAALQDIFNATSTMRNIQAGFASKFISGVESATVGIHNKNSAFEFPFTLAKVGAQALHQDYRGVFDANGGFKLEKYGMEKH